MKQMRLPMVAPVRPRIVSTADERQEGERRSAQEGPNVSSQPGNEGSSRHTPERGQEQSHTPCPQDTQDCASSAAV